MRTATETAAGKERHRAGDFLQRGIMLKVEGKEATARKLVFVTRQLLQVKYLPRHHFRQVAFLFTTVLLKI